VNNNTTMEMPRPFHPTSILKRQDEPMPDMSSPPPAPVAMQKQASHQRTPTFDRRDSAPNEQKQNLLNLFGGAGAKHGPAATNASAPAVTQNPNDQRQHLLNLFGGGRPSLPNEVSGSLPVSAFPGNVSGVGSPVSPLPNHATLARAESNITSAPNSVPNVAPAVSMRSSNSAMPPPGLPPGLAGISSTQDPRSRMSSITSMPGDPRAMSGGGMMRSGSGNGMSGSGVLGSKGPSRKNTTDFTSGGQSPITPKEKNFLLDYLAGVAKSGESRGR